jgi:hypothetical protein
MAYDYGLGDRIAAKGVPVEYQPGWEARSAGSFDSDGAVFHHTAGSPNGRAPSLGIVTYGRSDLPGPLAQVLQTREADGWDHAIVVAAGRANHAGSGGWNGLTGNSKVHGLEVEHTGTSGVAQNRLEVGARIVAAMLEAPGSTANAAYACQHFEWTSRKIDFFNLAPWFTTASFRARVGYWIGRTASPGGKDDKMYAFVRGDGDPTNAIYLTDTLTKRHMRDDNERNGFLYVLRASGAILYKNGETDVWSQAHLDNIPDLTKNETADTFTWWAESPDESPAHKIVQEASRELPHRIVRDDWQTVPPDLVKIYLTDFGSYMTEIPHQGVVDHLVINLLSAAKRPNREEVPESTIRALLRELESVSDSEAANPPG